MIRGNECGDSRLVNSTWSELEKQVTLEEAVGAGNAGCSPSRVFGTRTCGGSISQARTGIGPGEDTQEEEMANLSHW